MGSLAPGVSRCRLYEGRLVVASPREATVPTAHLWLCRATEQRRPHTMPPSVFSESLPTRARL
jgi:hypothetical protein